MAANGKVEPGEIITFYSYKGGTGRSMALANVGCILAGAATKRGGGLMIDWDLEAPGLHRYFQKHIEIPSGTDVETYIDNSPGLLDLFLKIEKEIPKSGFDRGPEGDAAAFRSCQKLLLEADLDQYRLKTNIPNLYLMKAGRFDKDYSHNVNDFNWDDLHRRSRLLFQAFAEHLREVYDFILIDSRTGLTDTSGICTTLMPEKLVVVFTPNRQSFTGVANLVKSATAYRINSDDVRPLAVFPLPSRIEASLEQLRADWRYGNAERGVEGYQPLFTKLFREVYSLDENECDLDEYFSEVQIQQTPELAFGEEIAVNLDKQHDRFSIARSYQTFAHKLVTLDLPWELPPLESIASDADAKQLAEFAEKVYSRFDNTQQTIVRRIFTRLVRIALPNEGSDSVKGAGLSEFGTSAIPIVDSLVESLLLTRNRVPDATEDTIEISNEALIRSWARFQEWINEDREFLLWRQFLRAYLTDWEKNGRNKDYLLTGTALSKAVTWVDEQADNLNKAEREYVTASIDNASTLARLTLRERAVQLFSQKALPILAVVLILSFVAYSIVRQYRKDQQEKATTQALLLTSKGRDAYELKNYDAAINYYSQAIDAKGDYVSAYLNRGEAYRSMNATDKALADYQKVIAISTDEDLKAIAQKGINEINKASVGPTPTPVDSPSVVGSPPPQETPTPSNLAPRIYVTLQSAEQKDAWYRLAKLLIGSGYQIPNDPRIVSRDVGYTYVQFYRKSESDKAYELLQLLQKLGISDAKATYLNDEDNPARMWHFEIVFSSRALQPPQTLK